MRTLRESKGHFPPSANWKWRFPDIDDKVTCYYYDVVKEDDKENIDTYCYCIASAPGCIGVSSLAWSWKRHH